MGDDVHESEALLDTNKKKTHINTREQNEQLGKQLIIVWL